MKRITKHFDTLDAEDFQNELYEQYGHVRLLRSPLFSESGDYVWEVK